ncbi:MAG: SPFH/Band 7/PHB domain protein [Clostridia bacterium]|nr:SPFH/Band 7/PHB domain protein [Clostridia bacterium]
MFTLLEASSGIVWLVVGIILAVVAVIILISTIKIVPQARASVVEFLGSYKTTWHTGVHFKIPILEKVRNEISLMEQVSDFPPQPVITKDNVRMQIDTVVFYQITDCKLYTYGVENPLLAIESLTSTTLRNIIGELDLDQTLTSRDIINTKMRSILDEATDPWGIRVSRVELKNIIPPKEIQDAMEKQMKAERERRESILRAEGEKNSTILVAEGQKQQKILAAEAEKASAILLAEAEKEKRIREAEGEAEAILKIQSATAEGIKMINEVNPGAPYISLKSLETLAQVADGKSTKIIIPSEIQNTAALVSAITETAKP